MTGEEGEEYFYFITFHVLGVKRKRGLSMPRRPSAR